MSILNRQETYEPTKAQKIKQIASRIRGMSQESYKTLSGIQKRGIDVVWNNPQGFTPAEVVGALGSDAAAIFQYHGALTNYIVSLAETEGIEPDIKLPTHAFTVNEDGTVTVKDAPYAP